MYKPHTKAHGIYRENRLEYLSKYLIDNETMPAAEALKIMTITELFQLVAKIAVDLNNGY